MQGLSNRATLIETLSIIEELKLVHRLVGKTGCICGNDPCNTAASIAQTEQRYAAELALLEQVTRPLPVISPSTSPDGAEPSSLGRTLGLHARRAYARLMGVFKPARRHRRRPTPKE